MGYIDFHSHVLPGIDDGARDVQMSVEMIKECISQNISTIVCTPHYYHSARNPVNDFLQRRKESYETLKNELVKNNLQIELKMGAEVNFNCDLSLIEDIEKLTIENTNYILIEMPYGTWQDGMFDYLYTLIAQKNLIPIIAHAERYYQNEKMFKKLENLEVYFQVNASSFLSLSNDKKNALKLLKANKVHIIGTDAHNMDTRPPEIKKAFSYIRKKKDKLYVDYLIANAERIICNEEIEKPENFYNYGYARIPFWRRLFK